MADGHHFANVLTITLIRDVGGDGSEGGVIAILNESNMIQRYEFESLNDSASGQLNIIHYNSYHLSIIRRFLSMND